jgi:predicted Zn-dependent peptidase
MSVQTIQDYRELPAGIGATVPESDSRPFTTFTLSNGLRVIFHEDHTTPMVVVNVIYHVGSKNEQRGGTGFAHLFEHLMFDGSRNVPRGGYDLYCTSVGGDNNAFTSSDLTDYFIALPSDQLALGLWLESDRMAEFAVQEISLDTQKSVVTEEKRQTIDNVPYGSMPELMRDLAYDPAHPYSWEIIGSMEDIAGATMTDVRSFYERFYVPTNALLVVAGDFDPAEAMPLVQGYFAAIPSGVPASVPVPTSSLLRRGGRRSVRDGITPLNAIFLGYHAPTVYDRDLHALELLSAIISDGESSRLYQSLEYTLEIASETGCYIDEGELGSMLYIYAVAQNNRVSPRKLRKALDAEIERVVLDGVREEELQKAKNRKITRIAHDLQSISDRAERLAYFTMLFNDPTLAFREADQYESITTGDIRRVAATYLASGAPNVVEYRA